MLVINVAELDICLCHTVVVYFKDRYRMEMVLNEPVNRPEPCYWSVDSTYDETVNIA